MRLSARLFVVDADDRLLLLDCTDPAEPETVWWEVPGVRVPPSDVGPLVWTQDSTYRWLGARRTSRCRGCLARVASCGADSRPRLTPHEVGTILGTRWWTAAEIEAYDGRFFPSTLPLLFPRLLAGERVDEPLDHWS